MLLLYLGRVVAGITAIFHVAGALAYPDLISAELVAGEEDHHQLESRAIVGSTTIPLQSVKGNDDTVICWVGFKAASGMASITTIEVSDEAIKETAYQTWKQVEGQLGDPGLIAVVYVPGGGWAAGSVWYGTKDAFQSYASNAPIFWNSVPGGDQGLNYKLNGRHEWHAEALATAQAEIEFGHLFEQGEFPKHTKIATYGKVRVGNRWETGYKAACAKGHSQVNVACEAWLDRLKIEMIAGSECN